VKFHNNEEQAKLSWANKQILMIQTENNAIFIDVLCVGVSLLMAFKLNDRAAHGHLRVDGGLPPKVDWSKWTPVGARSKVRGGNIVCGSPTVGPEGLNAYVESKIDEVFQTIGSWPDSTQMTSEFSRVDIAPLCDHVTCLCIKDVAPASARPIIWAWRPCCLTSCSWLARTEWPGRYPGAHPPPVFFSRIHPVQPRFDAPHSLAAIAPLTPTKVLVLQGGGALGSYQAGIYQALCGGGLKPDWVVGISIGAINAALIAGNPPERRLERLTAFWDEVTALCPPPLWPPEGFRSAYNEMSAMMTVMKGAPGFFAPRPAMHWASRNSDPSRLSFYVTDRLKATLERLVDFDYLNDGPTRLTVGAVEITTGSSAIFDSAHERIGPEHIMASGALPPGLPPVEIDGRWYWDGGVVSNTPLQFVINAMAQEDLFIFQVDLFDARGPMPKSLMDVAEREKDIHYSSRTRFNTNATVAAHTLKAAIRNILDKLPADFGAEEEVLVLREAACENAVTIVQLIYRKRPYEGGSKDYEFSRLTMREHWAAGVADGKRFVDEYGQLPARPRTPGVRVIDPGAPEHPGADK
jgi:NTE family protein